MIIFQMKLHPAYSPFSCFRVFMISLFPKYDCIASIYICPLWKISLLAAVLAFTQSASLPFLTPLASTPIVPYTFFLTTHIYLYTFINKKLFYYI